MIKKILFLFLTFSLTEKLISKPEQKIITYECTLCNNKIECSEDEIKRIESLTVSEDNLLQIPDNFKKLFPSFTLDSLKKIIETISGIKNLMTNIQTLEKNIEYQIKTRYTVNCPLTDNLNGCFDYIKRLGVSGENSFFYSKENFNPSKEIITADGYLIPAKTFCTCSIINPFTKKIVNFIEFELLNNITTILTKYIHAMILVLHANDSARWNAEQLEIYASPKVKEWQQFFIGRGYPTSYNGINWLRPRIVDSLSFFCGKLGKLKKS